MTALYSSVETYNLSFIVLDMIIFWVPLHLLFFPQKNHQEACQVQIQVQQEFQATRAPAATVCLRKAKCCLDIYEEVMTSPWGGNGIFLEETQKVKHAGLIYETSVDFQLCLGQPGDVQQWSLFQCCDRTVQEWRGTFQKQEVGECEEAKCSGSTCSLLLQGKWDMQFKGYKLISSSPLSATQTHLCKNEVYRTTMSLLTCLQPHAVLNLFGPKAPLEIKPDHHGMP